MSSEIKVDTISENTSANGVAIDSLGIKDGKITNLMNATLSAADLGAGIHIKTADSSGSANASGDELVIENNGPAGMTILSANDNVGLIAFGDDGANNRGYLMYNHDGDTFSIGTGAATAMSIDGNGHVTMPKQPAFLVQPTSVQTNFNQGQSVTVVFDTEHFDLNADFASNTFTAPVTGKYRFDVSVRVNELSTQDSSTYYYWALGTSNRVYYHLSSVNELGSGNASFTFAGSVLADMDANDTASITIIMGGTSGSGPSDISNDSYWSGNLVC